MAPTRSTFTLAARCAVVAFAGAALAACGSSGTSGSSSTATSSRPHTTNGSPATIGVAGTDLGNVLVDAQGRTLYLFRKDTGTTSTCTGSCATFWPPLIARGTPTTAPSAKASLVGTTRRSDGASQVTYNGHPVYLYSGDQKAGDTTGEGIVAFGAAWYALSGDGNQVVGSSSTGGSGSGY